MELWCRQLLRRYGVVFRDILTRESSAPSWSELAPVFRRLELRGDVRGGRFVAGVSGEQFAAEEVVAQLREVRDLPAAEAPWHLLSASDPLNLSGIVGEGARVAAMHRNLFILQHGKCIAAKQAGKIEFFDSPGSVQVQADMQRSLQTGRRQFASHLREAWLREVGEIRRPRSLDDLPSRSIRTT
jgi:ATP-dependent Lhr-like helicase